METQAGGRFVEGVVAKVELENEAGEIIGTVMVPYDPDNRPSEDEIAQKAWQLHNVTEHIRDRISDAEVTSLAESLRTGKYGEWIHSILEDCLKPLKVAVTSDDDDPYDDTTEAQETGREIETIIREMRGDLVDAFMGEPGVWEAISRDMLTHAWTWAFEELRKDHPDPEDISDEAWDAELRRQYKERPYLRHSIMQLTPVWGQFILEQIVDMLSRKRPDPEESILDRLEQAARKSLRKRRLTAPRAMLPGRGMPFDSDGRGFVPSYGAYRMIGQGLGRLPEWTIKSGEMPEFRINKYRTKGHMFIGGNNALQIWEGIKKKAKQAKQHGDILPDVYLVVVATMHAHRDKLDLFGNGHSYIALESAMTDLGFRKTDRKHNPDDVDKVCSAIRAIGDIRIRGVREAYIEGQKPVSVPFEGPLWQVMETIPKTRTERELEAFLSGERGEFADEHGTIPPQSVAGWSLAMGAGLTIEANEIAQEARAMRALMGYSPVHGRFKRRLGWSLSCEFRIRYKQQNWEQPYTVRDVLEDAPIPIDIRNPARTYKLFHEALETLQKDNLIGEVRYIKPPRKRRPFDPGYDTGRKGWLEPWLDAQIVIMPPEDVEAEYRAALAERLATRKRKRTPALHSAG